MIYISILITFLQQVFDTHLNVNNILENIIIFIIIS